MNCEIELPDPICINPQMMYTMEAFMKKNSNMHNTQMRVRSAENPMKNDAALKYGEMMVSKSSNRPVQYKLVPDW